MTVDSQSGGGAVSVPATAGGSSAMPVRGLTCRNCGGSLSAHAGLRVIQCAFCHTSYLVVSEIGSRRLAVEPRLELASAREIAQNWLNRGFNRDRRLRHGAKLGETLLCFLPFYRVEADCVGVALGTELRQRPWGGPKRRPTDETSEVEVERTLQKRFDLTYPALSVSEWGVQKISLHGDTLVGYDGDDLDRLGMVFPPTGSESRALEEALEQIKMDSGPARDLYKMRFIFVETLRERLSIVYYPLWLVRYQFLDRSYQILIDAEDGSLAYGKAPGDDLYRALMLVVSQAVVLFFATTALQVVGEPEMIAAVGFAALVALRWSWRNFRHGGVVIEGSGVESSSDVSSKLADIARRPGPALLRKLLGHDTSAIQS